MKKEKSIVTQDVSWEFIKRENYDSKEQLIIGIDLVKFSYECAQFERKHGKQPNRVELRLGIPPTKLFLLSSRRKIIHNSLEI